MNKSLKKRFENVNQMKASRYCYHLENAITFGHIEPFLQSWPRLVFLNNIRLSDQNIFCKYIQAIQIIRDTFLALF